MFQVLRVIMSPVMESPRAMGCPHRENRDDIVWCMVKTRGHLLYFAVATEKLSLVDFLYRSFE